MTLLSACALTVLPSGVRRVVAVVNGGHATCYFGWHHWTIQDLQGRGYTQEEIDGIIWHVR